MIIDQKDKVCDFCKRDEGLVIMPLRYLAIEGSERLDEEEWKTEITNRYSNLISLEGLKNEIANQKIESEVTEDEIAPEVIEENEEKTDTIHQMPALESQAGGFYADKVFSSINEIEAPEEYGYTQSFLRAGFLYVYLEHSQKLEEYMISPHGYLRKMAANSKNDIDDEPCDNVEHRQNARTITIPRIKELTNIYMAYSSVQWTEKVKKNVLADKSTLKKIDVKKWLTGQDDQNLPFIIGGKNHLLMVEEDFGGNRRIKDGIINKIFRNKEIKVNSFTAKILSLTPSFKSREDIVGLTEFEETIVVDEKSKTFKIAINNSRVSKLTQAQRAIIESDDVQKRAFLGMAVTLDDPIGLAMDVGNYVANFYANAAKGNKYYSDLEKTALLVDSVRTQLENTAVKDEINMYKHQAATIDSEINRRNIQDENVLEGLNQYKDFLLNPTEDLLNKAKKNAFNEYDRYINQPLLSIALSTANRKSEEIYADIEPVENWYMEILKSQQIKQAFENYYDDVDKQSKISFVTDAALVIHSISMSPKLNEFIACEYLFSTLDSQNFILKALSANDKKIKAALESTQGLTLKENEILAIQGAVFNLFSELKTEELDHLYKMLGQLYLSLQPAIFTSAASIPNGVKADLFRREIALLNCWSTHKAFKSGKRLYIWRGKAEDFQKGFGALAHEMALKNGSKRAIENITKAINQEASQQKNSALAKVRNQLRNNGDEVVHISFYLNANLDIDFHRSDNKTLAKALVSQAEVAVHENPEFYGKNYFNGFLNITGGIFQMLSIKSAFEEMGKVKNTETLTKFASTSIGVMYGLGAAIYQVCAVRMQQAALLTGIAMKHGAAFFKILFSALVMRIVVVLTTFFNTIFDILNSVNRIKNNIKNLKAWYLLGSSTLAFASVFFFLSLNPITLILGLVITLISVGLKILHDARIKEDLIAWLESSMVGIKPEIKPLNIKTEELIKIFSVS